MKDIIIPELVESIESGTISAWLVGVGDSVKEGDPIIELETDKIVVEVPAPADGTITEILAEDFEDVAVGQVVGKMDESGQASEEDSQEDQPVGEADSTEKEEPAEEKKEQDTTQTDRSTAEEEGRPDMPEASPAARKDARETGKSIQQETKQEAKPSKQAEPATSKTNYSQEATEANERPEDPRKPVTVERFSRRRQAIARNLVEAQDTMAMLTTFNEIDMTNIMALRKEVQDEFVKENDIKLGFMSFFTKAVISGLRAYPAINSELQGDNLILKEYYDIGVAVSTDEGLVVPVVRDADKKTFAQIEESIAELAQKARDNKLALEDMQGGTFTITNGGIFGSTFSTPIINMPQAAILGMHNIVKRPVAMEDGTVEVRPIMQVALTYDHRIVDGKDAASFLSHVSKLLSDPKKLLLNG